MWSGSPTAGSEHSASTKQKILNSIREHARRVGTPGEQIFPVGNTVVMRDDPADESAAA